MEINLQERNAEKTLKKRRKKGVPPNVSGAKNDVRDTTIPLDSNAQSEEFNQNQVLKNNKAQNNQVAN